MEDEDNSHELYLTPVRGVGRKLDYQNFRCIFAADTINKCFYCTLVVARILAFPQFLFLHFVF